MHNHYIKLLLLAVSIFFSINLLAEKSEDTTEQEEKMEDKALKGNIDFGYVSTSGNSETTNLNGTFNIEKYFFNWLHQVKLGAISNSDQNETTTERFKLEYQVNRKYHDNRYLFINTSYEEDKFSGFDNVINLVTGYGFNAYDEDNMSIYAEMGIGYRESKLATVTDTTTSEYISETQARLAAKYNWDFKEDQKLTADLTVDIGEETTISNLDISYASKIAGDFSMKVGYIAKHTSDVPDDKENLDTIVAIKLSYSF